MSLESVKRPAGRRPSHPPSPHRVRAVENGKDVHWPLMEAAGYIEVHHKTLRRAIASGALPAFQRGGRPGGHLFILHSDLVAWAYPERTPRPSKRQTKRRPGILTAHPPSGLIGERFDLQTLLAYGEANGHVVAA